MKNKNQTPTPKNALQTLDDSARTLRGTRAALAKIEAEHLRATEAVRAAERTYGAARSAVIEAYPGLTGI